MSDISARCDELASKRLGDLMWLKARPLLPSLDGL